MRQFPILLLFSLLVLVLSCKNSDVAPKSTPAAPTATDMDPPPATPPTTPPPAAMDPPPEPAPLVLPPLDRRCTSKADCTVTSIPRLEDGVCCLGCPGTPVARTWAEEVVRICDQYNAKKTIAGCPKVKCSDVPDVACVQGECRFQK